MASYLEIKQVLRNILCVEAEVDETCDMVVPVLIGTARSLTLNNQELKAAYDRMLLYSKEKLEFTTITSREVALRLSVPYIERLTDGEEIVDTVNGLTYSFGPATLEYCMYLLDCVAEYVRTNGRRIHIDLRHRSQNILRRGMSDEQPNSLLDLLPNIMRAYTLKITSENAVDINKLRERATSFEFLAMYKRNISISEYTDVEDMYIIGRTMRFSQSEKVDTPPQRSYNADVLDYYTMAMESKDPFSMYISFYHVIEHYFDAIFRKKLTEEIKAKITHPDFSYKSEDKLYELAKYIKKHLNSADDSGKGNEFESLKYVLMEYVPIAELKARINVLDSRATTFYHGNNVAFVTSKDTKIPWADSQGVYTKLAARIYETRNALVHSKSEQAANQYKPYENRKDLLLEIALIRAVAELVVVNSSEIL